MHLRCRKQIECSSANNPDVHMINIPELGRLRGARKLNAFHEYYYSFENIPYGYKPVDALRFKAPLPAEKWEGILDCTKPGKSPVIYNWQKRQINGAEDCLNLNIYVKDAKRLGYYPVIVYIYGQGFTDGSADQYKPDYFMQSDVVLVTINFRGGALGFLTFIDFELDVPGNAGLKDIVLALKWIQKHVRHFKGDSRNVTLMGQGSGAVLVQLLMTSLQAKGLFQKGILMSGSMLNPWAYLPQSSIPYRLALMNGYTGPNNERHLLAYLSLLPAEALVGWNLLNFSQDSIDLLYSFAPTIEPFITPDCILSVSYMAAIKSGWGNHIPLLIGGTSFEGLYMYSRNDMMDMQKGYFRRHGYSSVLPSELCCIEISHKIKDKRVRDAFKLFFGDATEESILQNKDPDNNEMLFRYLQIASIQYFWHGIHRTVLARELFATAKTFQYLFDFDSPDFNLARQRYTSLDFRKGVTHGDDLCYLFMQPDSWTVSCDTAEYQTIKRMIGMWTAFAANSDPNCKIMEPITWLSTHESNMFTALIIGHNLEFKEMPDAVKLKAWDNLYKGSPLYLN